MMILETHLVGCYGTENPAETLLVLKSCCSLCQSQCLINLNNLSCRPGIEFTLDVGLFSFVKSSWIQDAQDGSFSLLLRFQNFLRKTDTRRHHMRKKQVCRILVVMLMDLVWTSSASPSSMRPGTSSTGPGSTSGQKKTCAHSKQLQTGKGWNLPIHILWVVLVVFCPVTVVAERVVVPIVRATVPSAWGATKNAWQRKTGIDISRSGGIYQEEREKGDDCRAHFACNWCCFRQAVQFLRGFENKDSTITSAVKS